MGVYPEVSLKQARLLRDELRLQIANGTDPATKRKEFREKDKPKKNELFSGVARQWWEFQKDLWTPKHADRVWKRLADNAFAHLDQKPMAEIERADVVAVIRRIEERGALDVAKRVFQTIKAVFSYSVDIGLLQHDTISDMRSIVKHRKVQHRASMPNEMLGSFLAGLTINPDHPIGAGQKQAI